LGLVGSPDQPSAWLETAVRLFGLLSSCVLFCICILTAIGKEPEIIAALEVCDRVCDIVCDTLARAHARLLSCRALASKRRLDVCFEGMTRRVRLSLRDQAGFHQPSKMGAMAPIWLGPSLHMPGEPAGVSDL